jgi:hypothetical protein
MVTVGVTRSVLQKAAAVAREALDPTTVAGSS